jgi:predicted porin/uncharacterized coiled-coil protein SlyX
MRRSQALAAPAKRPLHAALAAGFATLALTSLPAAADELSELKAALQAQREQAAAQQARLEALEQKLQQVSQQQAAAPASAKPAKPSLALSTDQNGNPAMDDASGVTLYDDGNTRGHIYGIIEPTISRANHQTPNGGSSTGYQTSWFSGNRLGFDFDHALAMGDKIGLPGLKVITKLETEFELPTGNSDTNGVLFNRDAWAGFYSPDLGKLTFGRQNTLTRDFTANWGDTYGSAEVSLKEGGYSNVNNFKQLIFYSGGPTGTRYNSSVEWKKKWDDHWVTGLAYAFGSAGNGGSGDVGNGGSVPGDFTKGTGQAVSVAYNKLKVGDGTINLNASYDRANVQGLIHQSELFGGNYSYGPFRVNAGVIHYTAEQGANNSIGTRTDKAWTLSGSVQVGKTEFDLGYEKINGNHAGFNGSGVTINPFGNTSGVTSVADGSKAATYASVIYHADKQTDFYIAADYFKVGGDWVLHDAQGNDQTFGKGSAYSNETEIATGFRYKF